MDAVRADHRVGLDDLAGLEDHAGPLGVLRDRGAFGAQAHGVARQRAVEQGDEVGAVHVVHERAVALRRLCTQRCEVEQAARVQVAVVVALGHRGDLRQRGLEAELAQHQRAVGRDLHAGADLGHLRGTLQHNRVDAVMPQRQRCRQAANAATHNENLHFGHLFSV
ncbi:hypothetical protein FQZ97_904170 [compost metagenome]